MSKTLSHLNAQRLQQLQRVVDNIGSITKASKIYCYGTRLHLDYCWSPFRVADDNLHSQSMETFDLVLIMPPREKRPREVIRLGVGTGAMMPLNICFVIFYWKEAIDLLTSSNRFLCDVLRHGVLLHNSFKKNLSDCLKPLTNDAAAAEAAAAWTNDIIKANRCLTAAKDNYAKGEYRLAVYQLYAAALLACTALIRSHTGYKPETINVGQLLFLCENVASIKNRIFPYDSPREIELLDTLNHARQMPAHGDPCKATQENCYMLLQRVELLHRLAMECHQEKTDADALNPAEPLAVDQTGELKPINN